MIFLKVRNITIIIISIIIEMKTTIIFNSQSGFRRPVIRTTFLGCQSISFIGSKIQDVIPPPKQEITSSAENLTFSVPGFFDQPQPGGGEKGWETNHPSYLKFDPLELGQEIWYAYSLTYCKFNQILFRAQMLVKI